MNKNDELIKQNDYFRNAALKIQSKDSELIFAKTTALLNKHNISAEKINVEQLFSNNYRFENFLEAYKSLNDDVLREELLRSIVIEKRMLPDIEEQLKSYAITRKNIEKEIDTGIVDKIEEKVSIASNYKIIEQDGLVGELSKIWGAFAKSLNYKKELNKHLNKYSGEINHPILSRLDTALSASLKNNDKLLNLYYEKFKEEGVESKNFFHKDITKEEFSENVKKATFFYKQLSPELKGKMKYLPIERLGALLNSTLSNDSANTFSWEKTEKKNKISAEDFSDKKIVNLYNSRFISLYHFQNITDYHNEINSSKYNGKFKHIGVQDIADKYFYDGLNTIVDKDGKYSFSNERYYSENEKSLLNGIKKDIDKFNTNSVSNHSDVLFKLERKKFNENSSFISSALGAIDPLEVLADNKSLATDFAMARMHAENANNLIQTSNLSKKEDLELSERYLNIIKKQEELINQARINGEIIIERSVLKSLDNMKDGNFKHLLQESFLSRIINDGSEFSELSFGEMSKEAGIIKRKLKESVFKDEDIVESLDSSIDLVFNQQRYSKLNNFAETQEILKKNNEDRNLLFNIPMPNIRASQFLNKYNDEKETNRVASIPDVVKFAIKAITMKELMSKTGFGIVKEIGGMIIEKLIKGSGDYSLEKAERNISNLITDMKTENVLIKTDDLKSRLRYTSFWTKTMLVKYEYDFKKTQMSDFELDVGDINKSTDKLNKQEYKKDEDNQQPIHRIIDDEKTRLRMAPFIVDKEQKIDRKKSPK